MFLTDFFFFLNEAKSERFFFFPLAFRDLGEGVFGKKGRREGGRTVEGRSRRDFLGHKKNDKIASPERTLPSGK